RPPALLGVTLFWAGLILFGADPSGCVRCGLRVAVSFFLGLARLMLALLCSGLLGSPRGSALRGVLDPALPCTLTGGLRLVELNAALPFLQVRTGQGLQNLAVRLIQDGGRDGLDDRAPRLLRR